MGPYADYLIDELIPAIDETYRTIPEAAARGVFGKSSGGFGALHLSFSHPGHWAAAASHAGDAGFECVYMRDFPLAASVLARHRSEEHTSELQSRGHLVCRLLLEKKKQHT